MSKLEETQTWYKQGPIGVKCGCGSNSGYPITREWWDKHTAPWHTFKSWLRGIIERLRLRRAKTLDAHPALDADKEVQS